MRLDMGGVLEMSMSLRTCEPVETALSLGDDTHAAAARLDGA